METSNCRSCMMPLTVETTSKNSSYCNYCTNPDGELLSKEQVLTGVANFLQAAEPTLTQQDARVRAQYFMKAMPAWANT